MTCTVYVCFVPELHWCERWNDVSIHLIFHCSVVHFPSVLPLTIQLYGIVMIKRNYYSLISFVLLLYFFVYVIVIVIVDDNLFGDVHLIHSFYIRFQWKLVHSHTKSIYRSFKWISWIEVVVFSFHPFTFDLFFAIKLDWWCSMNATLYKLE